MTQAEWTEETEFNFSLTHTHTHIPEGILRCHPCIHTTVPHSWPWTSLSSTSLGTRGTSITCTLFFPSPGGNSFPVLSCLKSITAPVLGVLSTVHLLYSVHGEEPLPEHSITWEESCFTAGIYELYFLKNISGILDVLIIDILCPSPLFFEFSHKCSHAIFSKKIRSLSLLTDQRSTLNVLQVYAVNCKYL
jgi:hypothetical protein